jgi:hypothetical protein
MNGADDRLVPYIYLNENTNCFFGCTNIFTQSVFKGGNKPLVKLLGGANASKFYFDKTYNRNYQTGNTTNQPEILYVNSFLSYAQLVNTAEKIAKTAGNKYLDGHQYCGAILETAELENPIG